MFYEASFIYKTHDVCKGDNRRQKTDVGGATEPSPFTAALFTAALFVKQKGRVTTTQPFWRFRMGLNQRPPD